MLTSIKTVQVSSDRYNRKQCYVRITGTGKVYISDNGQVIDFRLSGLRTEPNSEVSKHLWQYRV